MGRGLSLTKSHWQGNQWPSIEFGGEEAGDFPKILTTICVHFAVPIPAIVDVLDGYATDFSIDGSCVKMLLDTWGFSLAAETVDLRDRIYALLAATDLRTPPGRQP